VRPGRRAFNRLFGRFNATVAWLVLVLACVHPPSGLGLRVCWTKASFGVPCPGCGLSRSMSATVRGDFGTAVGLNPFGPVFVSIFAVIAVGSALPRRGRRGVARFIIRNPSATRATYVTLIAMFLLFGVVRAGRAFAERTDAPNMVHFHNIAVVSDSGQP